MSEGIGYVNPANGVKAAIRWWDEHVPIGAKILVRGDWLTTWSHAGRGKRGQPAVFVDEVLEPVPLSCVSEIVVGDARYRR